MTAGLGLSGIGSAAAGTTPLMWRDVARVQILCLVATDAGVDRGSLHRRLCDRVREIASASAPVPVAGIALGDPAVLAPDTVTLLVHASLEPAAEGNLLAFTIRPYRISADQSGVLFAAPPRAVAMPAGAEEFTALDEALGASLAQTLPWLAVPERARPLVD